MGGFDFDVGLQIALFLTAVWGIGRLFMVLRLPPILGQLLAGILLGPRAFDMVPYASNGQCTSYAPQASALDYNMTGRRLSDDDFHLLRVLAQASGSGSGSSGSGGITSCTGMDWERWKLGTHITDPWTFLGNLGVTLMIMESGMHIHFDKVAAVGKKAFVVAVVGTGLPIVVGLAVVGALMMGESSANAFYPWGFAAGCAFAPTSVGISIKLLSESKMLGSIAGQTTLTAAFIDDVFSLVTLVILKSLAGGDIGVTTILVPVICSFAFLGFGVFLAIKVFPRITKLLTRVPQYKNVSLQPRDELHLFLMFATLAFFGWVSSVSDIGGTPFIGSHLLGAFVAGMCWVNVPRSHNIWQAQLKRIVRWLMRIFFAATVGFAVPVDKMFEPTAVWRGLVLGVGPCIATKLFSGLFAYMRYSSDEAREKARSASCATRCLQPQQLLVGIAMVARGEFAYLVAETAQGLRYGTSEFYMMSQEVYAAVVWALVLATITSPIMFRWALAVFDRATVTHRSEYIGGDQKEHLRRAFVIRIVGAYSPGIQREIFNTLHEQGVDVLTSSIVSVRKDDTPDADIDMFMDNFTVLSRGNKKDFDDEKLEEMHHAFAEILNDADAQIIFEPSNEDYATDGVVEVQVIGEHHSSVLHEITDVLSDMGLDVIQALVHSSQQPGHIVHEDSKHGGSRHSGALFADEGREGTGHRLKGMPAQKIDRLFTSTRKGGKRGVTLTVPYIPPIRCQLSVREISITTHHLTTQKTQT